MLPYYFLPRPATRWRMAPLLASLLMTLAARAQAPAWGGAAFGGAPAQITNDSYLFAAATDAQGNVLVTGCFSGMLTLGATTLVSAGAQDLLVAKWVPATATWAWAMRGGGASFETGNGIAVSGTSIYVTGILSNTAGNAQAVQFDAGGAGSPVTVNGASAVFSEDIVLAKYVDNGSGATLAWTQVGGGTGTDRSTGVAVSGSSVYVTGQCINNRANGNSVVFGGGGTTPGTHAQAGAGLATGADLVLAKYTDQGNTAALGWTQVAGGEAGDYGQGVAVSGASVYVVGSFRNTISNEQRVVLGGSGTTAGTVPVKGATATSSDDLALVKYLDQGGTAVPVWVQVGGGTGSDQGTGVAVSGSNIYVAGILRNGVLDEKQVVFGSDGSTPGTYPQLGAGSAIDNLLLAKYTDAGPAGSFGWSQVGGGSRIAYGFGVAARGNRVYVAGVCFNNAANVSNLLFGGSGSTPGTSPLPGTSTTTSYDAVLAAYTDLGAQGRYEWGRVGGGPAEDQANGLAISGQQVLLAGYAGPAATFGPATVVSASGNSVGVLAYLTDPALLLPTRAGAPGTRLALWPNPAPGAARLTGATPGTPVQVLDALGRTVAAATADATGSAVLGGLAPGLYLVRAGAGTVRLAVE